MPSRRATGGAHAVEVLEVATPEGPARLHVHGPAGPPGGALVLGHGAGGGVGAPDLVVAARVAVAAGWRAVLVEQPWRVAGRRVATPPPRLDVAWLAALRAPRVQELLGRPGGGPLVLGGRSAGARVACRTATALGADAVLTLAFPLHPPGRPERSRAAELAGAGVPVLAVQGLRDPFGRPEELTALAFPAVQVVAVDGDHTLAARSAAAGEVAAAVGGWLAGLPG